MKPLSKVIFILSCLLVFCFVSYGQDRNGNTGDEGMDIFLLTILIIGMSIMIGVGIVSSLLVLIAIAFLFALLAFGILSTSVAIGLYNRSLSSGFKSFIVISLGIGSGIIGTLGSLLIIEVFDLSYDSSVLASIGFFSGSIAGLILALASIKSIRFALKYVKEKFIRG